VSGRSRYARWALAVMSGILGLFGLGDVLIGPPFDPGITLGLSGLTLGQLEAESAAGFRMLDFYTRSLGISLMVIGVTLTLIVLIPYRDGRRWAWWAMWLLPAWALGGFALNAAFGVAEGQAPPPPMVSAPVFAAIAVLALIVDRGRFGAAPHLSGAMSAAARAAPSRSTGR
jgi:hypothetical protein